MIYGIGVQALGEQLAVSVDEASVFMESFKAKFTGNQLAAICICGPSFYSTLYRLFI